MGTPDKLIGISFRVTEDRVVLDHGRFAEGIVVEGMGSTHIREVHTPVDPGMDLTARRGDEEEIEESCCFPCARIVGKLMFLAGMTLTDISSSVRDERTQ